MIILVSSIQIRKVSNEKVSMASSTVSPESQFERDRQIWESLKQAISASSGFRRWQQQQRDVARPSQASLDAQVRRYLRETLETLAY